MGIDIAKFKPNSADEFFDGLIAVIKDIVLDQWDMIKNEVTYQAKFLAERTAQVTRKLAANLISEKEAKETLHLLQVNLASAFRQFTFMAYVTVQKILTAVLDLLRSGIRNVTGVSLLI